MKHFYLILTLAFSTLQAIACDGTISPSDTICYESGGNCEIIFTGSAGTAPYTFVYSVNGGSPQTITSGGSNDFAVLTVPISGIGNTQYTLQSVTDALGCTITLNLSSDILVVINPISMVSGTTTVYQNSLPFPGFTFSASGGVTPYTFYYTLNGGPVQTITSAAGASTAFLPVSTALVGVYNLELLSVNSPFNCISLPNSTVTTTTATITVIPNPMTVSGVNQTVCQGASAAAATFSVTGSGGPYTYTYTLGGVTQTITGGSPISIPASTSTSGNSAYQLTGIADAYGNYQSVNATSTVTVLPAPSGNVTISGGCGHYTLHFSSSGGSGPFTYTYTINGVTMTSVGGNSFNQNGLSVTFPTTFTLSGVSVTNAAGCTGPLGGGGTVMVQPYFSHSINASATSVCVNGPSPVVTFSTMGSNTPYPTFYYNLNSGPSQMVSNGPYSSTVNVPTTAAGTFVYTLFGTGHMCNFGPIQSVTVVVKPLPTATISGTTNICKNATSPVVTFTGANGTAPYVFTYKLNGGPNQSITSGAGSTASINVPTGTTGTFNYNLVSVSSAAGCSQNQTGSAVITVNPLPTATITGTTTLCQNAASPVMTFTGVGASAPYTFSYNINGGTTQTVSSGSSSVVTVSVPTNMPGTFTYNLLSVSSAAGCSQTQTGSAVVIVNPIPSAAISGSVNLCENDPSPTVTFTGTDGTAPYTFTYSINGGAVQSISSGAGSTASINVPTGFAGTFNYSLVNVSSTALCSQNQTGSAIITINQLPDATISGSATLCVNDASPTVAFTGANGILPYTFSYSINGGPVQTISSGTDSTASISAPTGTDGTFTYNLLSVSSNTGCFQTQTGSAVIVVNPLPDATLSGPTVVCLNDILPLITFTGMNGTSPYAFSYTINGGPNLFMTTGAGSTALEDVPTNLVEIYNFELINVTDALGCSQNQSDLLSVSVNALPVIGGADSVCLGTTIQLSGSGTAAIINPWMSSDISVATISNTGLVTAISPGSTLITYINSDGCSNTKSIEVLSLPTASISSSSQICEGDIATLTFSGTPNSTVSYSDGSSTMTASIPTSGSMDISLSGLTDTVSFTLLSVQALCSQSILQSVVIPVNPIPVMDTLTDITVCAEEPVQIPVFTGTNGTSFDWTNSNSSIGLASFGNGPIADFNAVNSLSGLQSATIEVTPSLNGCTGSPVTFELVVGNLPSADAGSDQSACVNDGITHFIGISSVPGNLYSWSPNANLSDSQISNPSLLAVLTGQTSYILTVTTSLGCENSDTMFFNGIESPVVSLSSSSLSSCEGGFLSFHLNTSQQVNIEWFIDNTFAAWNTDEIDLSTAFETSGIHSIHIVATNSFGCSVTDSIAGGVHVYPNVSAAFTTGLNSTSIDEFTDQIDLINQSENATFYNWYLNGNWFSTETNPTLNFEAGTGLIQILLVAENGFGCSDTASMRIEPLSYNTVYVPNTFTPDGNGTNELFMPVLTTDFDSDNYKFEIYNRWGELIFETNDSKTGWNGSFKGEACKTDTYIWKLTLKGLKTDIAKSIEGHVSLLK